MEYGEVVGDGFVWINSGFFGYFLLFSIFFFGQWSSFFNISDLTGGSDGAVANGNDGKDCTLEILSIQKIQNQTYNKESNVIGSSTVHPRIATSSITKKY